VTRLTAENDAVDGTTRSTGTVVLAEGFDDAAITDACTSESADHVVAVCVPLRRMPTGRASEMLRRIDKERPVTAYEIVDGAFCVAAGRGTSILTTDGLLEVVEGVAECVTAFERDRAQETVLRLRAQATAVLKRRLISEHLGERTRRTQLRRELADVRGSLRYRVATVFADAVSSPKGLLLAPRRGAGLARRVLTGRSRAVPRSPLASPARPDLRIAAILGDASARGFGLEASLVPLALGSWEEQLADAALLLVESEAVATGPWSDAFSTFAAGRPNALRSLLEECMRRRVPTVFWDNSNIAISEELLEVASRFDHVFTTADEKIGRYADRLGAGRVARLDHAAQPRIHNPIGARRPRLARVCFAGSWPDHEDGDGALRTLLDPPLDMDVLDIYARRGALPPRYRPAVVGGPPRKLVDTAQQYAAVLEPASGAPSSSRLPRRMLELLASGTPVVTTPSKGVDQALGDVVITTSSAEHTQRAVGGLIEHATERDRLALRGLRAVMREHTYSRRLDQVLGSAGLTAHDGTPPLVTVITVSNRPEYLHRCLDNYRRQTYEGREFLFIMNARTFDQDDVAAQIATVPSARVLYVESAATLGECLNEALQVAEGDYFAKFDDDDHYGPNYLADQMLAFEYANAAVVGKRSAFVYLEATDETVLRFPGHECEYTSTVFGASLVVDRSQTEGIEFMPVPRGTDTLFLRDCNAAGLRVVSTDRFNFVVTRHADLSRHTWQLSEREFRTKCVPVCAGLATDLAFV
jgi:hypothetical protein